MINKNIPGIYNYCDRWCERCGFTDKCLTFENSPIVNEGDGMNEVLIKVESVFTEIKTLLIEKATELGIDCEEILSKENIKAYEVKQAQLQEQLSKEDLTLLANQFTLKLNVFLDNESIHREIGETILKKVDLGIKSNESALEDVDNLKECIDVLTWYVYFISVKIRRALHAKFKEESDENEFYQNDGNGSAKIAFIGIEKCLVALELLFPIYEEDETLELLAITVALKNKLSIEFPNLLLFIRPGFDS